MEVGDVVHALSMSNFSIRVGNYARFIIVSQIFCVQVSRGIDIMHLTNIFLNFPLI